MKFFALRPLCFLCSLYLLIQLALFSLPMMPKVFLLSVGVIGLALLMLLRRREIPCFRVLLITVIAMSLGAAMSILFISLPMREAEELTLETHVIGGYVTERISYADYRSVYEVKLTSVDSQSTSGRIRIVSSYALDLNLFESFEAEGSFSLFSESINGYPERRVMASRGMFVQFEADSVTPSGESVWRITKLLIRLREELCTIIERYIGGDESRLTAALLLADRERLPEEINRDFSALGLSHVLAMSGLHLAILTNTVERIMKRLRIGKKLRLGLLTLLILLFTLLVGAPLSVVRSALMLVICYLTELLQMKRDKTTSLTLAAAIICAFSPGAVMDAGLQLSFSATLGMTAAAPGMKKLLFAKLPKGITRHASGILSNLVSSVCAVIFTLPFSFLYFSRISLLSPIATLIVTPFVQVILTAAPILLITAPLRSLAAVFAVICRLSAQCMLGAASCGALLHDASISLDYPFSGMLILALLVGAVLLFLSDSGSFRRWCALMASFVLLYGFGTAASALITRHDSRLIAANKGSKDYICLSHGGENILCDVSDGSYSGIYTLTEAMSEHIYDDRFDGVMLTHYHRRHGAMLFRLSREHYIELLILPEPETEEESLYLSDLMVIAEEEGMTVEFYRRGEEFSLCGMTVEAIPRSMIERSTHPLIALSFTGADRSAAYIGAEAYPAAGGFSESLLIFGGHGPLIREEISLPEGVKAVAISEDAYAALEEPDCALFTPVFCYVMRSLP